ncbi:hypothetical protein BLNAU_17007 [Blattamonas nauphoetae]|uniref:Protein kinase domain-containing protein n=1 Tax=Blattamonas nauphoetae TaxID=2049346 RepID=A0ABQ9XA24_9EUKA|nr:hypothetical protein BLNAU_17007 [Blattamonas nauphoetae]
MTSVKFTLCTFNEMTHTAGPGAGGAAICLWVYYISACTLSVTQCSFHKCTCTADRQCGGAIYAEAIETELTISISLSSFTECAVTGTSDTLGGSVFCSSPSSISVSDCFFEKSSSGHQGGALSLKYHQLTTLSNCAFVLCHAPELGGALFLDDLHSVDFSFLQFRGCSVNGHMNVSADIFIKTLDDYEVFKSGRFYDTDSGKYTIWVYPLAVDALKQFVTYSGRLPNVTVDVSISGDTATVTATVNTGVKGTMGILLEGSNVPRLVHVPFGSETETSTTGSATVSSGVNGILPPAAKYELRAWSVPTVYLTGIEYTRTTLSEDGNIAKIVLIGMNFDEGSYSMLIRNGGNTFNISLTRSNWTTLVGEAPLPPSTDEGRLEWGVRYEVEKVMRRPEGEDEENVLQRFELALWTPDEPARICKSTGAVLNKDRSEVTISLEGRAFGEWLGWIWVSVGGTFWKSLSMRQLSETHCEADFLVSSEGDDTHLKYEGEYTVCLKPDEPSTLIVESGITVRIPGLPIFTKVQFDFTNSLGTGCIAILSGIDLVVGTEYEVKLNTLHAFSIVVKSSTRAESSEMLIGCEGSLAYSADILIATVNPTDETNGIVKMPSPYPGQTQARPNVNEIFVDTETGRDEWTCGDLSRPCSTMDVAWTIIRTLKITQPTFSLLNRTSLSSQMRIENGMSVLMHSGSHREPSLTIPSSAAESATSALIVVSSAFLNIQNIDIVIGSSKPSFVLISTLSSEMILKDGLMTIKSDTNENGNELEELCLWKTGLIELIETELNVTNNQFFNISQGVMTMKGGLLTIEGCIFRNNFPSNSSFPSARRNIACSQGGVVTIGSLGAGDGYKKSSAWISSENCSIESTEVNADAPLFIPTLSPESSSEFDKKSKSFTLTIEGTILIPCSLFLEVFENGKDGTEVNSTQIPLTVDSVTSFTETKIVVSLPSSSVESLDDSLEWRGRLVFGENEITPNSFLIQQSSSGRFAQAVKDNMKWWIPLVVVLSCALLAVILVVVLMIRRRSKNKGENDGEPQEMNQTEDKIDVMMAEGDNGDGEHSVNTAGQRQLNPGLTFHESHSHPSLQNTNMVVPAPAGQAAVLIVGEDQFGRPKIEDGFVNSHDTLFNRLHGREKDLGLNIYRTRLDVAKAVAKLLSLRPNALALQKLNPHWVLLTSSNSVCFKLNDETPSQAQTTIPTQSGAQKEAQDEKRWSAPEEENCENEIDVGKVTVFSLGLILWEMTTGQVPFNETDAVNAQRQLGIGIVPRMDSIEPVELSKLLLECLDLNPHSRPTLESVVSRLESIGEGNNEDAVNLLELKNHQRGPQPES